MCVSVAHYWASLVNSCDLVDLDIVDAVLDYKLVVAVEIVDAALD